MTFHGYRWRFSLLILGLTASLAAAEEAASGGDEGQRTMPVNEHGLGLSVRLQKKVFRPSDPIDLRFELKNESKRRMFIGDGFLGPKYQETGPGRHFEVHVRTADGVPLRFWSAELTEGNASGVRKVFALQPGKTYTGVIRLSSGGDAAAEARGGTFEDTTTSAPHHLGVDAHRYKVVLRYQVNPESHGAWKPPADYDEDLLWTGRVDSEPLEFEVNAP